MKLQRKSKQRNQPAVTPRQEAVGSKRMSRRFAELAQPSVLQTKTWRHLPHQARATSVLLTTAPGSGGLGADPARVVAYKIRAALRPPDPSRTAGHARRIDPKTGKVISTIDPITRIETPVP